MTGTVGCKWVRWLGAFWSRGWRLCLNHQQGPFFPVKDTSLWFGRRLNRQIHTYINLKCYYRLSGEVIVLLLLQHSFNSGQIWPEPVPLYFYPIGSSPNPALTTLMGNIKRSCTHSLHMHQMSLRSRCCHVASDAYRRVIWKLSNFNWGLQKDQIWRQMRRLEPHPSHRYQS